MGFTTEDIKDALLNQKYNEVTATYLLLGLKTEVIQPHAHIPSLRHTTVEQLRFRSLFVLALVSSFFLPFAGRGGVTRDWQHDVAESEAEPHHQRNEQTLLHRRRLFILLLLLSQQDTAQRLHLPPPATAQRLL